MPEATSSGITKIVLTDPTGVPYDLTGGGGGGGSGAIVAARVTFNTDVAISATTEATANTIVTATAFTADGTSEYLVIFYCPAVWVGAAVGAQTRIVLYIDGAAINAGSSMIGSFINTAAGTVLSAPMYVQIPQTPSAGSHTYSIRGYRVTSNGTVNGTQAGISIPGYVEVRKS